MKSLEERVAKLESLVPRRLGPRPLTQEELEENAKRVAEAFRLAINQREEKHVSWSVNAIGRPAKVAEKVAADLARIKCAEPEETIKNALGAVIATSLAAFPPGQAVKVEGNGSQFTPDSRRPEEVQNAFSVRVETLHGFIE